MPKSSSDKKHFIILAALVAIATVLTDMLLQWALPLPVKASLEAVTIDWLIGIHLTLIAFLFALVVVIMLYAIVVFRQTDENDLSEGEHFHGNTMLEIAWTVIPLIAVVVFIFIGVRTLATVTHADENEIAIKVNGFQWAWSFEYNGATTAELVLPVNQRVRLEMNAKDVLHDFWVPEFRVKQDLVPGQETILRFTPTEVGEYQVRCAELCGLSHWNMRALVRVVEADEFAQWWDERLAEQAPALAESK